MRFRSLCIVVSIAALQSPDTGTTERGTIFLHFLQQAVGEERYEIRQTPDRSLELKTEFEYVERGSRVPLSATLTLDPDGFPKRFRTEGKSYRPFFVDSDVRFEEGRIVQRHFGVESEFPGTGADFPVDGYSPLSVQTMLVRYWEAAGRPERIRAIPTGPLAGDVIVSFRGRDVIPLDGQEVLETRRYTLENVAWGRGSLWLDTRGRFVAATTFSGGLPLEAVRAEYREHVAQFVQKSVNDRMTEARELRRRIPSEPLGVLILDDVTVLDPAEPAPRKNAVVIIRDGFIEWVGPRGNSRTPEGAVRIDARQFTVMPGLWDMHAHFSQIEWGPAYLAAGVTAARDMGGEFEFLRAMKAALSQDEAVGPRLFLAGLVDGTGPGQFGVNTADTAAGAAAIVTRYKRAGFDQIKLYTSLQPDVVRALTNEARRLGMAVAGHVPRSMTLRGVIESGVQQPAHIGPVQELLQDPAGIGFLKKHGVVVDPTLAWNELLGRPKGMNVSVFEPGILRTPFQIASLFSSAGVPDSESEAAAQRLNGQLAAVRRLHAAGIPVVAGTDKGIPGHSLHRELELYVKAGLTPMQAIRAATLVPARVMGMEPSLGSVKKGKRAELILVEGNPFTDISDIRRVRYTITRGRIYNTADLWESVGFAP